MALSKDEIKELRNFKILADNDSIRYKNIIKQKLLNNNKIIYLLNNKTLVDAEAEADEYFGVNILPYYLINPTQTDVQNYICYEVMFDETARYNDIIKIGQVIFYILCEQKNNIEKNTYIARHDLLSALILDEFNWSQCFGTTIHCVSDIPSVVDTYYNCRTLTFELETHNSIAKTKTGITRIVNYTNNI